MIGKPISKRAFGLDDVVKQIKSIWRPHEGFCENLFRILSYLIPFVPGLGTAAFILEKIAAFFGYGLSKLGKIIDDAMGWQASESLKIEENKFLQGVGNVIRNLVQSSEAKSEDELVKIAWFGGIVKLIKFLPKILSVLWKAVAFLLMAFGFTKVGDIWQQSVQTTKAPGELYLEKDKPEEKVEVVKNKEHDKNKNYNMSDEGIKGLMNLVTNPEQLVAPFTKMII